MIVTTARHAAELEWIFDERSPLEPLTMPDRRIIVLRNLPFDRIAAAFAVMHLARHHWFCVEAGAISAIRQYTFREMLLNAAAYYLSKRCAENPNSLAPVSINGQSRISASQCYVMADIMRREAARVALPLPDWWPLKNVLIGWAVEQANPTEQQQRLKALLQIPAAMRYLRIDSLPVDFCASVWGETADVPQWQGDNVELTGGELVRKLDWVIVSSSSKATIKHAVEQALETGTPAYVCNTGNVKADYAWRAYPAQFNRPPAMTPEGTRYARKRSYNAKPPQQATVLSDAISQRLLEGPSRAAAKPPQEGQA